MLRPLSIRMPDHQLPVGPFWLKEKKKFEMTEYTTVLGEKILNLEVGYETYGALNSAKDNAIVICHYYTGNSNAAGKYTNEDLEPGYWDAIIGPNKAIDTNRFFVIAVDSLCNLCVGDPRVITTGPATIDPLTKIAWAMNFPMVGIEDFVRVQKAVVDSFKIEKLYAVAGPSLGAMQVLQWAATYAEMVPRAIAVIGGGLDTPAAVAVGVDFWGAPIQLDKNWQGGQYTKNQFPLEGMKQALRQVTMTSLSPQWATMIGGREFARENPREHFSGQYFIQQALDEIAMARLKLMDPNHFLYIAKAVQNFSVRDRLQNIRAKLLFIAAESDLLMHPQYSIDACQELKARGLDAQYFEIKGSGGHLDGLFAIDRAASTIHKFLHE
jgi:homoserine O-acetyltransferase